jgi:hypothetical protein
MRTISLRKRELVGQIVNIAETLVAADADPYSDRSCIIALTKAGYPPRTIEKTLRAAQEIVRQIKNQETT